MGSNYVIVTLLFQHECHMNCVSTETVAMLLRERYFSFFLLTEKSFLDAHSLPEAGKKTGSSSE